MVKKNFIAGLTSCKLRSSLNKGDNNLTDAVDRLLIINEPSQNKSQ